MGPEEPPVDDSATAERAEEAIWVRQIADQLLGLVDLPIDRRGVVELGQRDRMSQGVVAYPVSLGGRASRDLCRARSTELLPDDEERRPDPALAKDVEHPRRHPM
jgi:hypothetical protein